MVESVIQLRCECNNYPWGKVGEDSLAAHLCSKTPGTEFNIEKDTNYAEMWMGTYPVTPSYVLKTDEKLQDVLDANKEKLIGKTVLDKFGADLPFLPKILSIQKALPLQIHPDIELSKKLHQKDPEKFGDSNHKPEIAVALSRFEAFCGFKNLKDLEFLLQLDPLKQFRPGAGSKQLDSEALRGICRDMLSASESTVSSALEGLHKTAKEKYGKFGYIVDLVPRLVDQYGKSDNGSLVALVCMNYLVLEPGQAIWIPADGIHAYLAGDIVECMARSDNVLNTGFCPRADRDSIDTFCEALTFKQHDEDAPKLSRSESEFSTSGKTSAFKPPMSEFNMLVTELKVGEKDSLRSVAGPGIMFVTGGKGKMQAVGSTFDISEGYIYFIGQGVEVEYEATSDLAVYRAYAE